MTLVMAGITPNRYIGSVCQKHPALGGLRRKSNRACVGCAKDQVKRYQSSKAGKKYSSEYKKTEKYKRYRAEYRKAPHQIASKKIRERAYRRLVSEFATPQWADLTKIGKVYARCKVKTESTGTPHHVDHVFPLNGELVCGLHVHNNLRVIKAIDNLVKGNRMRAQLKKGAVK